MGEVQALAPDDVRRLETAPFTYSDVGGTARRLSPPGFHDVHVLLDLKRPFEHAAEVLMTWRMHEGAGLRVRAGSPRVVEGAVVELGFGIGPFRLRAPCRVIAVHQEPGRVGFTYGTLAGHPESGEERFEVVRRGGADYLEVTAFSRPGILLTRLAGPLGPRLQDEMIERYRRALDR